MISDVATQMRQEALKHEWTDQFVKVNPVRPGAERRFEDRRPRGDGQLERQGA